MLNNLSVVLPGQTRTRKNRTPNFPVAGVMKPFGLYPIMCHPVLPGETLEHAQCKIRVISKPLKHPLAGAWLEHWWFYVKLTDLSRSLTDMFVTDTMSTTGYTAAANAARYFVRTGQIDWVRLCTERIHASYFRHDNEALRTIDGVPLTKLNNTSWFQNALFKADVPTPAPGSTVDVVDQNISAFEMMRQMMMTELTYERYLEQYGVQSAREGRGEPEILRYARSWTMPNNTVEPTTGAPSSALIWSDDFKLDKPKLFSEPGFLIQLACVRPKMFAGNLQSSVVGTMWGFSDWFPAYNLDDPAAGVKELLVADGVVTGQSATVFVDYRDILNHGEQFVNAGAAEHPFALPTASVPDMSAGKQPEDLRGEYATLANVDALFVGATATDRVAYYEGITQLRLRGHVVDTTPRPR